MCNPKEPNTQEKGRMLLLVEQFNPILGQQLLDNQDERGMNNLHVACGPIDVVV